jgi:dipeptidyl aminopeptidase/acylaminoacyl peptidase
MSLLSAKGYVIVIPNRRGCPGFGQKWIDDITKD